MVTLSLSTRDELAFGKKRGVANALDSCMLCEKSNQKYTNILETKSQIQNHVKIMEKVSLTK